jgi:hypothetical protein
VDAMAEPAYAFIHQGFKMYAVTVFEKNILTTVAPEHYVVQATRQVDS